MLVVSGNHMEQDILNTLQEIRGILLVIVVFFLLWIFLVIYSSLVEVFPFLKPKKIEEKAEILFEKGYIESVIRLCESNLLKRPNHASSVFWLAKAKYSLRQYEESSKLFHRVLEIEPNWKIEYIQPYIDKIIELQENR